MAHVSFAVIKKGIPKRTILAETFRQFLANDLPTSAAAISYFAMLGLYPFFLLLYLVSEQFPQFRIISARAIETVLGLLPTSKQVLESNRDSIVQLSRASVISCILIIVWVASWAFTIVERAINRIWRTCCRSFWHGRVLALAMMIVVTGLLALSAMMTAMVGFFETEPSRLTLHSGALIFVDRYLWQLVIGVVGLLLTIALFCLVYTVIPNTPVKFVEALPGAILAGGAWELAKYLFTWSLVKFPYDQLYGSIAAVVATLTWIYISALVMLFGAQMTALLHREDLVKERVPVEKVAHATVRFGRP